ncbi:yiaA/B two helix domain protein [Lyngbya aestuarii BL J]|uniref:YiaA/B two helix domain protein n=1 Tax=Lyngbya aestuarii BL J TaxID=1348334 RepID=U7QMG5_9CYAN|nr:YiaA/YiaB family inner membrane protein [Lyngbya aestuarii]ERT09073.1 yiaA/B two helix domain protein [Lyngbya aestuarii BL J]
MSQKAPPLKDTSAWIFQVWLSFILAVSATALGIIYLPVDNWVKGFMGMGMTFSIGSSFTLAKTIRDNHETYKLVSRVDEARIEKLLADHDLLK